MQQKRGIMLPGAWQTPKDEICPVEPQLYISFIMHVLTCRRSVNDPIIAVPIAVDPFTRIMVKEARNGFAPNMVRA